jgi:uncharacterized protein YraI
MRRRRWTFLLAVAVGLLPLAWPAPVAAEPATSVAYPAGASATHHAGLAFDTCTAPSLAALTAWAASPYRAVGIYIGGANRTCAQPQLTAGWVTQVSQLGWRLLPIYMGRQAPCSTRPNAVLITPSTAATQGTAAAADAVTRAKALGLLPGSAIYDDMENYPTTDSACRTAVLQFLSGWTKELHRQGYVAAVYANLSSGAKHLSDAYTSTALARPDVLWIARWDGSSALTGWAGIPDGQWAVHQRAKQYVGDHTETWGGTTINIDNDRLDAPVATVAYAYTATSSGPLNARSGPATSYPVVRTYAPGATVQVACQAAGAKVGSTSVWDKLTDGTYATDYYVSTPSNTTWSAPLPRCTYPYQVTAANGLSVRTGPGTSYAAVGKLPNGSLAWVTCQRSGGRVNTTAVWDRLNNGYWVSDYYVATPSNTTYSKPSPRC